MSDLAESIEEAAEAIFDVIEAPQAWASARAEQRELYRKAAAAAVARRNHFPIPPTALRAALTKLALTDTEEIPTQVAVDKCIQELSMNFRDDSAEVGDPMGSSPQLRPIEDMSFNKWQHER
jgi:hypothetical protein